jgi:hypothetical protein
MNPHEVKLANEARLRSFGLVVNVHLPTIEEVAELTPRSARDVSARAGILSHLIGVGYGRTGIELLEWLREANLTKDLSPRESAFLKQMSYSDQERIWASWQVASVHACAWALGLEDMDPIGECPDTLASHFPPKQGPNYSARLRSFEEIYCEADFYYRLHWAARQAGMQRSRFPVQEFEIQLRRKSLDWIIGLPYEWDDVPNDT